MVAVFRAALFIDLDNTLVINPLGRLVMPKIYKAVSEAIGKSFEDVAEMFKEKHLERVRAGDPSAYDWDDILEEIVGSRRIGTSFLEELASACRRVEVLDDALEVLEMLRAGGFYMVLATNGLWKYQECVVREAGLAGFFDEIVAPDLKGCLKSSERFYEIGITGIVKISVGDNAVFDVYYPKLFGLKAVHVRRSDYVSNIYLEALGIRADQIAPDEVISSLSQLPAAVEAILSRRGPGDGGGGG